MNVCHAPIAELEMRVRRDRDGRQPRRYLLDVLLGLRTGRTPNWANDAQLNTSESSTRRPGALRI